MVRNWGILFLMLLFLVGFPHAIVQRWLTGMEKQETESAREGFFTDLEDVLHRTNRNGRPDMFCKAVLDQAAWSIHRGQKPGSALGKARNHLGQECEIFLFSEVGEPLAFDNKPLIKTSAWRRLMQAILKKRVTGKPAAPSDEKLAAQLLGDRTSIDVISGSFGHFRRTGDDTKYSHAAWWQIGGLSATASQSKQLNLLVLLPSDPARQRRFRVRAVKVTQKKCRGRFSLALTGNMQSRSFRRLSPTLRHAVLTLPGGQGRFSRGAFLGVYLPCRDGFFLTAWGRCPLPGMNFLDRIRRAVGLATLIAVIAVFLLVFSESWRRLSLRWIIPGLILTAILPLLGFLGFSMQEQRQNIMARKRYEAHRAIEQSLRSIDLGFTFFQSDIAKSYQSLLEQYYRNPGPGDLPPKDGFVGQKPRASEPQTDLWTRFMRGKYSRSCFGVYGFNQQGNSIRTLITPEGQANLKFVERLGKRSMEIIFGGITSGDLDYQNTFITLALREMGHIFEWKMLYETKFLFIDYRSGQGATGLVGAIVWHDYERLIQSYLHKVCRSRLVRQGIHLGLVGYENETLIRGYPARVMHWPAAIRLTERVLDDGKTVDTILSTRHGKQYLATGFKARNLGGIALLGAIPLEDVEQQDQRLALYTWNVSGLAISIALACAFFLTTWVRQGFQELRIGIDHITSHFYGFSLALTGQDEFCDLARGLEKAAVTLDEIYSSRPVLDTLVACDAIHHPNYHLTSAFFPGKDPGGNCLDAFTIGDDQFALVIGDVFGRGWQTALVTAAIRTAARLLLEQRKASIQTIIPQLNSHFQKVRGQTRRMSLLVAIIDLAAGTISWTSAGACPPILQRSNEQRELAGSGLPLGAKLTRPVASFSEPLLPGDTIILYTDSWWKTPKADEETLGYDGFINVAQGLKDCKSGDLWIARFQETLQKRGFPAATDDDRSLLVLSRA